MAVIFFILFLLALAGLIIGLIKPSIVKTKLRKNVAFIFGAVVVILFFAIGLTAAPSKDSSSLAANVSQQATSTPLAQSATSSVATTSNTQSQGLTQADHDKIVALLKNVVENYTQVYATGKTALGMTQYANSSAGLQAMSDPNSSAAQFSAFNQTWKKTDWFDNYLMPAYREASDIYFNDNTPEDALDNWRDDMNTLDADIGTWINIAIDWQDHGATDQALQQAEQKIAVDFRTVANDMAVVEK